jgi:hypothetical protein
MPCPPHCSAGKLLNPYQGLKPAEAEALTLIAGKLLNPYQGLKLSILKTRVGEPENS